MGNYNFLEKDGYSTRFKGEIMKIYIPSSYFEFNTAEFSGITVTSLALFYFEVKTFEMEQKNQDGKFYLLKLPAKINFEFEDNYKETKDIKNSGMIDYTVFVLNNGNIFMSNENVERNSLNAKDFIYLIHRGRFPSIIPYEEIIQMYLQNLELNNFDLETTSTIIEFMLSELFRWNKDEKIAFRKAINMPNVSSMDYKNINMSNLSTFASTFSSLSFQDFNQSVISSIKRDINNEKQIESPAEKIIKY